MLDESLRTGANAHIPDFHHICCYGVYCCVDRAADRHSGPVSALGDPGSSIRLHGRNQHAKCSGGFRASFPRLLPWFMCWQPVQAWPTQMNEARQAVPSRCSKPHCKNCRRWTASMPALRMAPGCRCGASATLPKSSANACGRLRMRTSRSISFAPPRKATCRYGGYFKISRATRSTKSICGNTATTPANGPGTGRRCRRTDHTFQNHIFLSV